VSLASGDLTTLPAVKAYLANYPGDPVASALISRVSAQIRAILNRRILVPTTYVQQFSGQWTRQLVLPEYPLLSLSSLLVGGLSVPIAPQPTSPPPALFPGYGYRFQPWNGVPPGDPAVLDLIGLAFCGGFQNVVATYKAGYQVTGEAQTIPAGPGPYTVSPSVPYGSWASDQGVAYAVGGAALTPISSGTPTVGQYLPPDLAVPRLNYTFAAADATLGVLLTYGYVPADLEGACIELIAERASYRSRVGLHSQALASQETLVYDRSGLPAYIVEMLRPYESVLPPAIGAPV
jgi:hypothetical protein